MTAYELEHLEPGNAGPAVVALTGELDLTNADDFVERIGEMTDGGIQLALDLNRVVFIDSAAIRCLFRIVRERGATDLAFVVEPTAPVAATLEIVELRRIALVARTVDEAKAALTRTRST